VKRVESDNAKKFGDASLHPRKFLAKYLEEAYLFFFFFFGILFSSKVS